MSRSGTRRMCELPGCHTLFIPLPGSEGQKYCCAEHRKQARIRRLDQTRRGESGRRGEAPHRPDRRPDRRPARHPAGHQEGPGRDPRPPGWSVAATPPRPSPGPHEWLVPHMDLTPWQANLRAHRLWWLQRRHQLHRFEPTPQHQAYRAPRRRPPFPTRLGRTLAAVPALLAGLVRLLVPGRRAPDTPAPSSTSPAPAPARIPTPRLPGPRLPTRRLPTRRAPVGRPPDRPGTGPESTQRRAMPMAETLRSAVDSLTINKLRSALTMLGIVIGVSAVIMLVSLGNGMRTDFDRQFAKLGNQITIEPAAKSSQQKGRNLTDKDVSAIAKADYVQSVSPSMSGPVTVTVGQNQARSNMAGVKYNYLDLLDRKIVAGRWFTEHEGEHKDQVAVVGLEAVALLGGPTGDPSQAIGGRIRVNQTTFEIIGVLEPDGQNDNVVIVPFEASRAYLVGDIAGKVNQIVVKSTDASTVGQAAVEVGRVLDLTHRVHDPTKRDFNVLTYTNLLNKSSQFINFMSLFIVAIAAVSLLVGGIGVANIMLVSVTERTREIGIRKAIGASSSVVMRQFLSEAVMLTCIGGAIGVVLGIGATLGSIKVLPQVVDDFPPPILSTQPVLVAFAVSAVIGVLAGGYPAWRASRMRPIDALRFE